LILGPGCVVSVLLVERRGRRVTLLGLEDDDSVLVAVVAAHGDFIFGWSERDDLDGIRLAIRTVKRLVSIRSRDAQFLQRRLERVYGHLHLALDQFHDLPVVLAAFAPDLLQQGLETKQVRRDRRNSRRGIGAHVLGGDGLQ